MSAGGNHSWAIQDSDLFATWNIGEEVSRCASDDFNPEIGALLLGGTDDYSEGEHFETGNLDLKDAESSLLN